MEADVTLTVNLHDLFLLFRRAERRKQHIFVSFPPPALQSDADLIVCCRSDEGGCRNETCPG